MRRTNPGGRPLSDDEIRTRFQAMKDADWNQTEAAQRLNITGSAMHATRRYDDKAREWGFHPPPKKNPGPRKNKLPGVSLNHHPVAKLVQPDPEALFRLMTSGGREDPLGELVRLALVHEHETTKALIDLLGRGR